MKIALVGPGKMGRAVSLNLTREEEVLIIGRGEERAKALAEEMGWPYSLDIKDVKDADIILFILDAHMLNPVMAEAAAAAKAGAVMLNVATKGVVDRELIEKYPRLRFADGKIIGSAVGIQRGLPGFMVVKTQEQGIYEMVKKILPGFKDVVQGDADLVPKINSIGSREGIRAAVIIQKELEQYDIPKEWADMVVGCVCTGTIMAYVDNILGHFAAELAEKIRQELGE